MPSFRRRAAAVDVDSVGESPPEPAADSGQARALAEEAEAEAAEAEATAAAARARARALRLRRQAEQADEVKEAGNQNQLETVDAEPDIADAAGSTPNADDSTTPNADDSTTPNADDSTPNADEVESPAAKSRWRRLPHPTWKGIAASVVVLCTAALLAGSGYMIWNHRQAEKLQQQNAEYAAAARQSVVTLMSLDFNTAQENVQRIIDNSTGQFKDDFEQQAADFVMVAQDSEVVTDVTVNSTAVETMTDESAVVLVAAASRVTNASGANQEPRTWRLSVGLQKEDGQIKMSRVEFVP